MTPEYASGRAKVNRMTLPAPSARMSPWDTCLPGRPAQEQAKLASSFTDSLLRRAYRAHQARRLRDAESLYLELLAQSPEDVDACNLLGLLHLESGRPADAADWIGKAVALRPADPQAHYNLGLAFRKLGRLDDAAGHFQAAAVQSPQNAEAHNALANVLRALDRPAQAIESYRRALALSATHAGARTGLSQALNDIGVSHNTLGAARAAIAAFQEAVAVDPGNAEAWINAGILLEQTGRFERAAAAFRAAIAARPAFADAHFQLAHLRGQQSTADEIRAMESLYRQDAIADAERALLAFGLARACEKSGDRVREFSYLQEAHALKLRHVTFDADGHAAYTESLLQVFDAEWLGRVGTQSLDGADLIFVVGMPRSGTSLTEQILASHARVFGAGEQAAIATAARRSAEISRRPYPYGVRGLDSATRRELAGDCAAALRRLGGGRRTIVEKTPANFLHVGLIATLFPRAKIIHCMRHPLDTCLSIYQHPLADAHAYANDFDDLAAYYRLYLRLMDHWRRVLPDRVFDLRYERLVMDLEPTVRGLLEHCELPFDSACLSFHATERTVRTPSASQVRQPLYSASVDRWRRYAEQLAPLRALLADEVAAYQQP